MQNLQALRLALELWRMPGLLDAMQRAPLPPDVLALIRIAGGCSRTLDEAVETTGEDRDRLLESAAFFIQNVMLHPGADCLRILGGGSHTSRDVLRQHRNWLLKWQHPDRSTDEWEAVFAHRINAAWEEIERAGIPQDVPVSERLNVDLGPGRMSRPRGAGMVALPWIRRSKPTAVNQRSGLRRAVAMRLRHWLLG